MEDAKKLAVAYAAMVPEDVHVPTLAKAIEREGLTSLEAVGAFLEAAKDASLKSRRAS